MKSADESRVACSPAHVLCTSSFIRGATTYKPLSMPLSTVRMARGHGHSGMAAISHVPNDSRVSLSRLHVVLLLLLVHFCSAAELADRCQLDYHFTQYPNQVDRRFLISENAPTAAVLRTRADLRRRVDPMIALLRNIVEAIDFRRRTSSTKQCNLKEDNPLGWVYTAHVASNVLQIGALRDQCYSELDDNDAVSSALLSKHVFHDSMHVVAEGVQALYEALSNITQSPQTQRFANWTHSFPLRGWKLADDVQTCNVETFSAYRMRNSFFLRASMTNHKVEKYVEDWNRQFVSEWVSDDYSQSLSMRHPSIHQQAVCDETQWPCGTTLLEKWGARAWISWHGEMKDNENPAVLRSSEHNTISLDLAEDSIAPANIAILVLPMAMNLIPFALIAEPNTIGALLYIIFTDVISTVPFLIKGIELISATRSRPTLVAYYAGDEELADIQVWVADCRGTGRFSVIGWTFVALSIFAIALGIVLELLAKLYMKRRRKDDEHFETGPFGKAMFDYTRKGILGAGFGHDSDHYSEYSSEVDTMESGVEEAKADYGSQREIEDTRHGLRESVLRWIWILSPGSPLGAWVGSSGAMDEEQAGVGHDGLASSERFDMYPYEK